MDKTITNQEIFKTENVRRGRVLEYFTIGWNLIEAIVAFGAGLVAGSTSLIGFGVDSLIESSSGITLLWRLQEGEQGEQRENFALKLVGVSLLLLAGYIAFDAGKSLIYSESPRVSFIGIGLAILSVIIMPILASAKRKVAENLNSKAMKADSRQTDICAYLSAILLIGLGLNALFGWWWADSIAGLFMIPIIIKEAFEALRGETCGDCHC
ncbi:MAG: cation diffusion facilitator family transporter [Aridibacter sp.]